MVLFLMKIADSVSACKVLKRFCDNRLGTIHLLQRNSSYLT